EDGIRDRNVTGVQTCPLPIYFIPTESGQVGLPGKSDRDAKSAKRRKRSTFQRARSATLQAREAGKAVRIGRGPATVIGCRSRKPGYPPVPPAERFFARESVAHGPMDSRGAFCYRALGGDRDVSRK